LLRQLRRLEQALGTRFRDRRLLETALTHRSYAFERESGITNERLEFLGDAVLGLVVTDLAYRSFPDLPEGELAKLRAATVNMTTLADVARELGLGDEIFLGRGEEQSGGRDKPSILADAMEAILGAVYLDRGLKASWRVIDRLFWPRMAAYARGEGERDYKTTLQERAAQDIGSVPQYRIREEGPDHAKEFTATVLLAGRPFGTGRGRSKKEAEQRAARQAFDRLTREGPGELADRGVGEGPGRVGEAG
jgi:ribonuclease III